MHAQGPAPPSPQLNLPIKAAMRVRTDGGKGSDFKQAGDRFRTYSPDRKVRSQPTF